MTISGLLGRDVTPAVPIGRFDTSGPSAIGGSDVLHYVDRGSYGHSHGGGGKGGGKGQQSAMSALTLLAFLFFINLLQNCLKESMAGNSLLMLRQINGTASFTRPKREISEDDVAEVDALPGPGVYWNSNILIRHKGDPGSSDTFEPNYLDNDIDGEVSHNALLDLHIESSREGENVDIKSDETDFDYQDEDDSDSLSKQYTVKLKKNDLLNSDNKFKNSELFSQKDLKTGRDKLSHDQDGSFNRGQKNGESSTARSGSDNIGYYKYNSNEYSDTDWDYYQDDENTDMNKFQASETRDFLRVEPTGGGFVKDRYDLEEDLGGSDSFVNFPSSVGNYAWTVLTSVSSPIVKRIQTSFHVAHCHELVVCEAHRLGRAWGTSGLLLASGISEVIMWMYGEDEEHRRLILEAAANGRARQTCRVQMQLCEDKSRNKSVLPIMATLLEQFV